MDTVSGLSILLQPAFVLFLFDLRSFFAVSMFFIFMEFSGKIGQIIIGYIQTENMPCVISFAYI